MTLRKTLAGIALLAFSAFNAHAGIEKDDKTISLFGSFTSSDDADTLTISAAGGYFYTDTLELQGVALISSTSSGGSDVTVAGYGANANLYLPGNNPDFIPYVGGGASIIFVEAGTIDETEFGLNGQAGIKQFVTEDIAINYQAQYVTSSSYDAFILSVGFSIFIE